MQVVEKIFPDGTWITTMPLVNSTGSDTTIEYGWQLRLANRGTIMKLIVAQLDTSNTLWTGFTYTLYNYTGACPPGANPTATAATNGVPEVLYRVAGPITVASGSIMFGGGGVWPNDAVNQLYTPYQNLDPAGVMDPTNSSNYPYLYLKISAPVTAHATKQFGAALTIGCPLFDQ